MSASNSVLTSRAACIVFCFGAFFATIMITCRRNTAAMLSVLSIDGLTAILWVAGACMLGAVVLNLLRIRANLLLIIATAGGLGLGIFSLLGLFLGLAGWLNRPIAISLPVGSMVLFIMMLLRRPGAADGHIDLSPLRRWLIEPAGISWLWIVPVIALAMVCISASILPGVFWKPFDPAPYDVTSYHLQVPREWYEAGRIVPLPHNVFSYFPFNVEMQFLLLMHVMGGPWTGMYACQFVCAGYYLLMVLGVAGACGNEGEHRTLNIEHRTLNGSDERSTLNAQRSTSKKEASSLKSSMFDVRCSMFAFPATSVIGATFAAVVPWVMMLSGVAYVESALMLYTALAVAWAMRAIDCSASTEPSGSAAGSSAGLTVSSFSLFNKPLLLAGVMSGFAAGVKITAIPMLLLAVPAAVFFVLMFRRPPQLTIRWLVLGCAGFVIAGSVIVSPWLVRNCIWAGNPVWPLAMKTLGTNHFSPDQVERFIIAHSPRADQQSAVARVGVFWRDVLDHWQYGYILLPAGLLALVFRWNDRRTWLLLLTAGTIFIVWIGFTHLLARFLVMLIPLAGIAIGRVRWGSFRSVGIAMALMAACLSWVNFVPELMKQSAVPPNQSLIGIADLAFFLSPEIADARQNQMHVGMIGDAQSFLYQIPMTHLHYCTVFDLPADVSDPVEAWAGKEAVSNPDYWLVVNTSEIDRLHRTYRGVPPLPAKWEPRLPETFFLRADDPEAAMK